MTLLKFLGLSAAVSSEVSKAGSGKVSRFLFKSSRIVGSEICQDDAEGITKNGTVEEKNRDREL